MALKRTAGSNAKEKMKRKAYERVLQKLQVELCHLQEFNHSQNFWKLVAAQIPDYKRVKKALKLYSFY